MRKMRFEGRNISYLHNNKPPMTGNGEHTTQILMVMTDVHISCSNHKKRLPQFHPDQFSPLVQAGEWAPSSSLGPCVGSWTPWRSTAPRPTPPCRRRCSSAPSRPSKRTKTPRTARDGDGRVIPQLMVIIVEVIGNYW